MGDARPRIQAAVSAFGLPAWVTRPGASSPVSASVIWLPNTATSSPFQQQDAHDPRRVMAVVAAIADVPHGTTIDAPEAAGGASATWVVEEVQSTEVDHWRVIVSKGLS